MVNTGSDYPRKRIMPLYMTEKAKNLTVLANQTKGKKSFLTLNLANALTLSRRGNSSRQEIWVLALAEASMPQSEPPA